WWACMGVFVFQAEDGIRGRNVTGVQTCALPICWLQPRPRGGSDRLSGLRLVGANLLHQHHISRVGGQPREDALVILVAHLRGGSDSVDVNRSDCKTHAHQYRPWPGHTSSRVADGLGGGELATS